MSGQVGCECFKKREREIGKSRWLISADDGDGALSARIGFLYTMIDWFPFFVVVVALLPLFQSIAFFVPKGQARRSE